MRLISFSKCSISNVDFRIAVKKLVKIFSSRDNFIWIGLKISDITKKDFLQLKFSQNDGQRWENYYRVHYSSVWDSLTCRLSWGLLKTDSLDINISTNFTVYNFGKTKAMRPIFFSKYLKSNLHFGNSVKNSEKIFCFLDNLI